MCILYIIIIYIIRIYVYIYAYIQYIYIHIYIYIIERAAVRTFASTYNTYSTYIRQTYQTYQNKCSHNVWDFCVIRTMHVACSSAHTDYSTNKHTQNECALERRLFVKFCMHFTCVSHDKWKPDLVSVVNTYFDMYGTH